MLIKVCIIAVLVGLGWMLMESFGIWLLAGAAVTAGALAVELVQERRK